MYKKLPKKRYERTLAILKKYAPQGATILDVGVVNPFSELMQAEGYTVRNTQGEDLDFQADCLQSLPADFCYGARNTRAFSQSVSSFTAIAYR